MRLLNKGEATADTKLSNHGINLTGNTEPKDAIVESCWSLTTQSVLIVGMGTDFLAFKSMSLLAGKMAQR